MTDTDLRTALEFYADRQLDGYDVMVTDYGLSTKEGHIIRDGGEIARAALAQSDGDGSVWDENAQRYYTAAHLKELLDGRDKFIVEQGLFEQFVMGTKDTPAPTKPCTFCLGTGIRSLNDRRNPNSIDCPDCNGTGEAPEVKP